MAERGGRDPARTLALLWRTGAAPARGPKPGLTVDRIVATAIAIADAEGLAALSMRRVADRLGVGAMSLYTYVPGRADLVDLMQDTVYGQTPRPEPAPGDWRAALTRIAWDNWALVHTHPWMLQVPASRLVLGPGEIGKYEYELGAVEGIGLSDVELDTVLDVLLSLVRGAARTSVERARDLQRTGMTEAQWWQAHAPLLAELIEPRRYPLAVRVGAAAGAAHDAASDPRHTLESGLRWLLDGVEALVRTRGGDAGAEPRARPT